MTIKPFAIQGADLTLGGVSLQAGTTGVVIPGVTQATGYGVEEVKDVDVQVDHVTKEIVIDKVVYNAKVANASADVSAYAVYAVSIDDNNFIDEIEVTSNGSYTQQEATANDDLMYAYGGTETSRANALSNFNQTDWFAIPFVPKMRAKEIENVGGTNLHDLFVSAPADLNDDGSGNFVNFNVASEDWMRLGTFGNKKLQLITNYDNNGGNVWEFTADGGLKFPDSTTQTTAYTGQVGTGSTGWALLYGGNVMGQGGENDYIAYGGSCADGQGTTYFFGETIAFTQDGTGSKRPIITKVDSEGAVQWSTVIGDYVGRAVGAQYIVSQGNYIILLTEDETDNVVTKQWSYMISTYDGSVMNAPSYTIPSQAGVGVVLQDSWFANAAGFGTYATGWVGWTANEVRVVTLNIMNSPAPTSTSFAVLKSDLPGLTLTNYSSCYVDSTNPVSYIHDHSTYWIVDVTSSTDFTTGTHTIQIPQSTNATIGITTMGGPAWKTVGKADDTYEYYRSGVYDQVNNIYYAVGNTNGGHSMVSSFDSNLSALWHKNINLSESYMVLTSVALDNTGNAIYVVGDNDNGAGYLTKMDTSGNIIWQRKLGNSGPWGGWALNVAVTPQNEVIVAFGSYGAMGSQNDDILIFKFDTNGNALWQRTIGTQWYDDAGGIWNNWGGASNRFLTVDATSLYLSLYIDCPGGKDAAAVKLPLDGTGLGTWGSGYGTWTYSQVFWSVTTIDVTAGSTDITGLVVSDFTTTSGEGSTPTLLTSIQPSWLTIIGNEPFRGIARSRVDGGNQTTTLDASQNGKFIYFYQTSGSGNSTIFVPNNSDTPLPIGYTVSLVMDQFDDNGAPYYGVYVSTDGNTSDGLRILASGFDVNTNTNNYWIIGGDGKAGIYTLMKVDTNRWILSGPNVGID